MIKIIFIILILLINNIINCQLDQPLENEDNNDSKPFPNLLGDLDTGYSYFPIIDGLKLHIRCYSNSKLSKSQGEILLFDSGLPLFSTSYGNVIEMLLNNNTMNSLNISSACFFDRYGYGWSDLSSISMNSKQFLKKLYLSIQTIPIINNSKFYYVGWSYGGLLGQTFAMLYPNAIKGLLLIDSSDIGAINDPKWSFENITNQIDFIIQNVIPSSKEYIEQLVNNGILTLTQGWINFNTTLPKSCISKTQKIILNSFDKYYLTAAQELSQFISNILFLKNQYDKRIINSSSSSSSSKSSCTCNKSSSSIGPLGNLPLVVISSNPVQEPDWYPRQIEVAKLSSNSCHLNSTDHFVPINQPELIIKSIKILLNKN